MSALSELFSPPAGRDEAGEVRRDEMRILDSGLPRATSEKLDHGITKGVG